MHSLGSDKPSHTCVLAITLLAPLRFSYGLPLILVFSDLPRAVDEVVRNDMRLALHEDGIPNQEWLLLDDLLDQDHVRIHLGDLVSEDFQLASGTAQGRRVSTDMFNGVVTLAQLLRLVPPLACTLWGLTSLYIHAFLLIRYWRDCDLLAVFY